MSQAFEVLNKSFKEMIDIQSLQNVSELQNLCNSYEDLLQSKAKSEQRYIWIVRTRKGPRISSYKLMLNLGNTPEFFPVNESIWLKGIPLLESNILYGFNYEEWMKSQQIKWSTPMPPILKSVIENTIKVNRMK